RHTRFSRDWSSDVCSSDLARDRRDGRHGGLHRHGDPDAAGPDEQHGGVSMARRRSAESRIFFPWEQRGSLVRRLGLRRARPVMLVGVLLTMIVLIGMSE